MQLLSREFLRLQCQNYDVWQATGDGKMRSLEIIKA